MTQTFFKDWKEAHTAAQNLANEINKSYGLEKTTYFEKGFRIFMLPAPQYRQGFELRCEVVNPAPKTEA